MSEQRELVEDFMSRRSSTVLTGKMLDALADEIASLRACIKWTDEVYPDRIYGHGARVELTWDEFNAMRVAAGFKPRVRIEGDETKSGLNHRLRVRIQELEAQLASARKGFERIKQATIAGRVCDDVAWFDEITTLHDFCEQEIAALTDELREVEK